MQKTILIIEDEIEIAELEKDYLEAAGYNVIIANDGEIGLDLALNEKIDLIILDLMLPKVSGYQICETVRNEKEIPILMVTARNKERDMVKGFSYGPDDYINKPFSPSELVTRVKAHLLRYDRLIGKQDNGKVDVIEVDNIKLYPDEYVVKVNEVEVKFTNKEFDLLYKLISNPNHVFSKKQLFEQIWLFDATGDISTVTVHINRIREKIEPDINNPKYIETVWGVGYRFRKN